MKKGKQAALFCLGGAAYVGAELLWRGRSHISMFFAGGLCFLLIGALDTLSPRVSLPLRALMGAGIITAVELAVGLLINRSFAVWDYRQEPGNLWGQICPGFSMLWVFVSLAAGRLYRAAAAFLRGGAGQKKSRAENRPADYQQ